MISETDCKVAAQELEAAGLSPRERDVLVFTCKGLSSRDIAERISRSPATVEKALFSMRQKLRMTTIEAVVLAVKAGWV